MFKLRAKRSRHFFTQLGKGGAGYKEPAPYYNLFHQEGYKKAVMTINIIDKEKEPHTLQETFQMWQKLKARYTDAIVIIRKGNDYYSFESDAQIVSSVMNSDWKELWNITKVVIIPVHQTDILLSKVVRIGYRIAICEPQFFSLYQ